MGDRDATAREYNGVARFSGMETSYSSDFKWKMNTEYMKSNVIRRLPNGHNPHPRDAQFIDWLNMHRVCNMSTYDRPMTGYVRRPRSRKELTTTSSLAFPAPPKECYRAQSAGAAIRDKAELLSSSGVRCALSTWDPSTSNFPTENSNTQQEHSVRSATRNKQRQLANQAKAREVYKPKICVRRVTKEEVAKMKHDKLETERQFEQTRYRNEIKKQMEKSSYDYTILPFHQRNTEDVNHHVSNNYTKRMLHKRVRSACPAIASH